MANDFFSAFSGALEASEQQASQRRTKELGATTKRILLTQDATEQTLVVGANARKSANTTRQGQLEVLGSMDSTIAKAKEAIRLSDSNNPLDRLQLWALQQGDPSGYTRTGNTERLTYLQDASNSLGNRELLKQAGFMDEITGIQADLEGSMLGDDTEVALLKAQEMAGKEAIQATLDTQAARLGMLQNQVTMQATAIQTMTPDQVRTAQMAANESPTGTVNIGGVQISAALLGERANQLDDREYLMDVQQVQKETIVLNNMTQAQVANAMTEALGSADGLATVSGTKVSLARLQERNSALSDRNYANAIQFDSLASMAENNLLKTQARIAQTFSIPELNEIISNGGYAEDGTQYDLGVLTNVRELRSSAQQDEINNMLMGATVGDPMTSVTGHDQWLKSIQAAPGSALESIIKGEQVTTNVAGALIASGDPARVAAAMSVVNASRAKIEEAVTAEATRLGAGDKDLAIAYGYQLRGLPIPQEVVTNAIIAKKMAGKPVGQWLTPQNRGIFDITYQAKLAELEMSQPMSDTATRKAQAAEAAMDAVMTTIGGGLTPELMAFQFQSSTNPLKGVIKPEIFMSLMHQADVDGAAAYQRATGATEDQMAALNAGEYNPDFVATQAAQLYLSLEKAKPGLGQSYLDWWNSPERQSMAVSYNTAKSATTKDFTELSELSLVLPGVPNALATYASTLADGQRHMYADDLRNQHMQYVTFNGDASTKQAFLLQSDPALTATEKQQAFALIFQPLIDQVTANNMPADQASTFIESQIRSMRPTDPVAKGLLTKILAGRDTSLNTLQAFVQTKDLFIAGPGMPIIAPLLGATQSGQLSGQVSQYQWYKELKGQK